MQRLACHRTSGIYLATVHFFALLRRPNGKSDRIKTFNTFNTFESLMMVFGYVFWIRFVLETTISEIIYTVAKYVTF